MPAKTKSKPRGNAISDVEVSLISTKGFWVLVGEREYFLDYDEYPWFRDARVSELMTVALPHENHLRWPLLDIDIELDSLASSGKYPLIYKP